MATKERMDCLALSILNREELIYSIRDGVKLKH